MAHVLVVEDSNDLRDVLCEWLFEVGFDAIGVSTAREAKDLLGRLGRQCLVLLDLGLPDEPGEAVLSWIRAHPQHRDAPIVVVTANLTKHVPGSNALLGKPVDFAALLELIERHISPLVN